MSVWTRRKPVHGGSLLFLTAMDGGNVENAGAFFGHGNRRSNQTRPRTLVALVLWRDDF